MLKMFIISVVTASVSFSITRMSLFAPLRIALFNFNHWLGHLFSCPYCFSHWVAAPLVWWYGIRVIEGPVWLFDYIMSVFFVVMVAAALHMPLQITLGVIRWLDSRE
jgi:hypothetical protein